MTTLVARPPLQVLSMSAMQTGSRRLSTRLQEKEDVQSGSSVANNDVVATKHTAKVQTSNPATSRKRKNVYDEDEDGFAFSRVSKNKKPRQSKPDAMAQTPVAPVKTVEVATTDKRMFENAIHGAAPELKLGHAKTEQPKKKRKKMSFSTPKAKPAEPLRRSKRLSGENEPVNGGKAAETSPKEIKLKKSERNSKADGTSIHDIPESKQDVHEDSQIDEAKAKDLDPDHSATKITLPFADTPVIRRNKAMREGKGMKGDRRSSLGLRGRRASSLIETGNSNALPHQEVDVVDFYKHIESEQPGPRRMRQLLTWCATRAMHPKPKGTDFEDASAKSAARVIEEELLKEISNKSEYSDWFSREDVPKAPIPLPQRPNPKNVQNLQKIAELQDQIDRLKLERDALQSLLSPPEIRGWDSSVDQSTNSPEVDRALLSDGDVAVLETIQASSQLSVNISRQINDISSSIGPSIDRFADTIHKVAQFRTAADATAGKILSICADKLAAREKAGRMKALHSQEDRSPGRDLSNVLRGLSKADH